MTGPKWEGDLHWEEDPDRDLTWHAHFPWISGASREPRTRHYTIYEWDGHWAYGRPEHGLLGDFSGSAASLAEAKAACLADFAMVRRIHDWVEYIKTHDPPAIGIGSRL